MELQAVTGQLYIVAGAVADQTVIAPGILASPPPAKANRSREKDFLFVHLTLSGSKQDQEILIQDLLDALHTRFYKNSGSVTAALRQSVLDANQLLLHYNVQTSGPAFEGSVTCAVLRHQELFVAQAGTNYAWLTQEGQVRQIPEKVPQQPSPLGRSAGLDIRYAHYWLRDGSMLLLSGEDFADLSLAAREDILLGGHIETGLNKLVAVTGEGNARLILVEFVQEELATLSDYVRPQEKSGGKGESLPPPTGTPVRDPDHLSGRRPLPELHLEENARKITAKTALGLSNLTGGVAAVMAKIKPPRNNTLAAEEEKIWYWSAILAVIIPILVAAIVTGAYFERGRVSRFSELKQEMWQHYNAAQAAPDQNSSRISYEKLLLLAVEADAIYPGDEDISYLRDEANRELDQMDDISRLTASQLFPFPAGSLLNGIILQPEGNIYVLDNSTGQIQRIQTDPSYLNVTNPATTAVIKENEVLNQPFSAGGSYVVGPLIDMVWRPKESNITRDGIAAIDSRGGVVTYFPNFNDILVVRLEYTVEWKHPQAATTFDERLYILDKGNDAIWRYFPDGNGFSVIENQESVLFSTEPDLQNAADIAIYSEDGSILILYHDGRLRRYISGRAIWDEADLAANGLSEPMINPNQMMLVGRGLNTSLFVADPASGRILQFSLGGRILAQFKAETAQGADIFKRMQSFTVAENPMRILFTTDDGVYVAKQP